MLTDTKLRNLKSRDKLYKVNDRDGLYVAITPAGSISFRYNYSINGRQETITFGRYGVGGITLAEARERLGDAKRVVANGKSPAKEKARDKARVKGAETFAAGKFQASCRLNIKFYAAILSGFTTSWGELFWVSA
ncbi:Arm DNA-binding domain-containing protein [Methylomonas albis]